MGFLTQETVTNRHVYLHKRKDDGIIFYVGIGKGRRPWSRHGRNIFWNRVVEKHGGFLVELAYSNLTEQEAAAKEVELIAKYQTIDGVILTNLTTGGDGSFTRAKETIDKMSIAQKARKHSEEENARIAAIGLARKGKPISEEHKNNISQARQGWVFSEETRNKIGLAHKGKKKPKHVIDNLMKINKGNTYRLGMPRTPEEKAKLSAALKGKPWSEARRAACKSKTFVLGQ